MENNKEMYDNDECKNYILDMQNKEYNMSDDVPFEKRRIRAVNIEEGCRNNNCNKCDARVDGRLYVCKNLHVNKNINTSGYLNVGNDISFKNCDSLSNKLTEMANDINLIKNILNKIIKHLDLNNLNDLTLNDNSKTFDRKCYKNIK